MAEKTLIAKIERDSDTEGTIVVASPVVGYADGSPKKGLFLNPLDKVVTIRILNRSYALRLPRDTHGRITEVMIPNAFTPVAYGQAIARLDPRALSGVEEGVVIEGEGEETEGVSEGGLITVKSPSEGIFYRRPSPDSPPFVDEGAKIATGTVLGLVEVMKCFNQITYGGPDLPPRAEVVRILVEDNAEVAFGQVLFKVRPSG